MYFNFLLILIQFTQIVIGSYLNSTYNETCHICNISWLRRKRAITEYTRWRANLEPTEEFIVKILDEDISTPRTKQIVAVNIQPVVKGSEKIIISGASVPTHSAVTMQSLSKDYTRFISLTKSYLPINDFRAPTPSNNVIISQNLIKGKLESKYPKVKYMSAQNLQRDDSPPASPQFIPRSGSAVTQQFAPIPPVSFTRSSTLTPLGPRRNLFANLLTGEEIAKLDQISPSRTTPNGEMVFPLRTFDIDQFNLRRTTFKENHSYESKNEIKNINNKIETALKKDTASYRSIFYPDVDSESITTKRNKATEIVENSLNIENNDDTKDLNVLENVDADSDLDNKVEPTNLSIAVDGDKEFDNDTVICAVPGTIKPVSTFLIDGVTRRQQSPCSIIQKRELDVNSQRTLHEIVTQLKKWADNSPVAKWVDITNGNYTNMENPIYMMIVDDPSKGQTVSAKESVMIVAGIQGKDHHAVAAAMYLLYELIERSDSHSELLTKYRFWIIPVFNPDGYDYSMTFPQRRGWTKNLRQTWNSCKDDNCACEEFGIGCTIQPCYGVNLDRNFEYQWIPTELRSEHPCGMLYAGSRQLSEVETNALTQYLHDLKTLYTFIAYKEGDVLGVMYPYSHTKKKRALDHIYRYRASRAANAAYTIGGRPYVAGQTSEFLPLYAGGVDDWADGHLGIDNTYTIMMFRPTDAVNSKLIMERVVHEAYAATQTLLLSSTEPIAPPLVTVTRAMASTVTPTLTIIFTIFIILLGYG